MKRYFALLAFAGLFLSACDGGSDAPPLEGERISILELQDKLVVDAKDQAEITLPAAWANQFWPQSGGYPNHAMQHLSLPADLDLAWETSIGRGQSKKSPLTAQPIVVDGIIYTMDTKSMLRAFDISNGKKLWSLYVGSQDDDEPVITGGLAFGQGRIYATNGLNELIAVDAKSPTILWRKSLLAPSQAAPAVMNGRIFVVTIDDRLLALSEEDGSLLWEYQAVGQGTGLVGSASPAVNRDIVVAPFSSGELVALRVENGSIAWSDRLQSVQAFGGLAMIADIHALPIIDKGLMIAMNYSGKLAALDMRSGRRIWQRDIGGENTPWVVDDTIFLVSSDQHLIALRRETGLIKWVSKLRGYENPEKNKNPIRWYGPIIAGNRTVLMSSDGVMMEVSAQDGSVIKETRVKDHVIMAPIVAGDTLYTLSENGSLRAYR